MVCGRRTLSALRAVCARGYSRPLRTQQIDGCCVFRQDAAVVAAAVVAHESLAAVAAIVVFLCRVSRANLPKYVMSDQSGGFISGRRVRP